MWDDCYLWDWNAYNIRFLCLRGKKNGWMAEEQKEEEEKEGRGNFARQTTVTIFRRVI